MATRDPYFFSARAQATSARLNNAAKGWVGGKDNIGSSTSQITGVSDTTIVGTSVSPFVHSNRRVKIEGTATLTVAPGSGVTSMQVGLLIVTGSTTIARIGRGSFTYAKGTEVVQWSGSAVFDVSVASSPEFHLEVSYISVTGGTGTIDVANTSPAQARIDIEDIGAAS